MSKKTIRVLMAFILVMMVLSLLQDAWEIFTGPTYYDAKLSDGPGYQLLLVFNAISSGVGASGILVALYYLVKRGGLQAPILRSLGHYVGTSLIVFPPIIGLIITCLWFGGVLPNHIAWLKPLLIMLEILLLFYMMRNTQEGVFAPDEEEKR